jgi:mycobactin lysine-N-oxygenase
MPTLAVVGAGPKGIAIAAKARALAAAGLGAPRVMLVDQSVVAGNWSGRQGYTGGLRVQYAEEGLRRDREPG